MTTLAVKPNTAVVRRLREDPAYRAKEAERRTRYREKEYAAVKRRRSTPEGWAKHQIPQIKHRAKKADTPFDLTWEDIVPPAICPVLGIPLRLTGGATARGFQPLPDVASVDRVNNSLGYVRGNVRVISFRANILKKDASPDDLRRLADWIDKETAS